jgi:HEAT repeats
MHTDGHGFFGKELVGGMMNGWRGFWVGAVGIVLLAAGGCSTDHAPKRNFDELIPRMMGSIQGRSPENAAINLFNVTNPDERRDAIAYLQTKPYGHEPPYMRAYEILTTDPSAMVRAQAMRALGTSHQAEAVPYLINGTTGKTGLSDPEDEVREDAAQGLGTTFGPAAIQPLADRLRSDTDDQVRINAARALAQASTETSLRALIDALDDRNTAVIFYAHASLVALTGQQLPFEGKPWLEWYQRTYEKPAAKPAAG